MLAYQPYLEARRGVAGVTKGHLLYESAEDSREAQL
jgi:hypothetical protein